MSEDDVYREVAACLAKVRDHVYRVNVGALVVAAGSDLFDLGPPGDGDFVPLRFSPEEAGARKDPAGHGSESSTASRKKGAGTLPSGSPTPVAGSLEETGSRRNGTEALRVTVRDDGNGKDEASGDEP